MISEQAMFGIAVLIFLAGCFPIMWFNLGNQKKFSWPDGTRTHIIPFLDDRMYRELTRETYVPKGAAGQSVQVKDVQGEAIIEIEEGKQ